MGPTATFVGRLHVPKRSKRLPIWKQSGDWRRELGRITRTCEHQASYGAITFRTEDNVHMCLSFEKMHMMEPRTERIKPHLDLAVGLWLLYSTLLKIQFLWLDLRLWLHKHLLRHTVRQYECLTRPYVEYRDLLLALWLSRKDCVHSPDVLLRRWAETENFHPNQLLRAERKNINPGS